MVHTISVSIFTQTPGQQACSLQNEILDKPSDLLERLPHRMFSTAVSFGTSKDNVQHGDTDVFGTHHFVLHRAAELLSCLDDALLPVL